MENNEIIEQLYMELIDDLLSDIDVKYHEEVRTAYKTKLIERVNNFGKDTGLEMIVAQMPIEKKISIIKNSEMSSNLGLSPNLKLSTILDDNAFSKIVNIANVGFKAAQERAFGEKHMLISSELSDENINNMNLLLPNVREFNKDFASEKVGEGELDYRFASGQSNNTSMRLGKVDINFNNVSQDNISGKAI